MRMTKKSQKQSGNRVGEGLRNRIAWHTYGPCVCLHGCMYECVLFGSLSVCMHATNELNAEKKREREGNRRH